MVELEQVDGAQQGEGDAGPEEHQPDEAAGDGHGAVAAAAGAVSLGGVGSAGDAGGPVEVGAGPPDHLQQPAARLLTHGYTYSWCTMYVSYVLTVYHSCMWVLQDNIFQIVVPFEL